MSADVREDVSERESGGVKELFRNIKILFTKQSVIIKSTNDLILISSIYVDEDVAI